MNYALEERIGNPDLFTGRKEELAYFLKWINDIKERKSQSTAVLEGVPFICPPSFAPNTRTKTSQRLTV
jgi:hypothetical protein